MDDLTRQVSDMYARFPYPSPQASQRKLRELRNLLSIFSMENRYDMAGKSVLDAGTGTGHRVVEAAAAFTNTRFLAVDVSETPLRIARQVAADAGVENVEFGAFDIMDGGARLGSFDVVLSMGVIHHLADPASGLRNLVANLADDGIVFVYIYGKHGGRERMRRKQVISYLLNGDRGDFQRGIQLAKDLRFDSFDYGWNLDVDDEESLNTLIVDAYLNVNERLFDIDGVFELMKASGLYGFATFGLTLQQKGCLFESRLLPGSPKMVTQMSAHLTTAALMDAYTRLSLPDRYRLVDLLFQPNGYTLIGFTEKATRHFPAGGRILSNALTIEAL